MENFVETKNNNVIFLEAMTKTKTWINFEDIETILLKEHYESFINNKKTYFKNYYLTINGCEAVRMKVEELTKDNLDGYLYEIFKDDNGEFWLKEVSSSEEKRVVGKIDVDNVDTVKLAWIVETSMQKYLNCKNFRDNGVLEGNEIHKMLKEYIELARKFQIQSEERQIAKEEGLLENKSENELVTVDEKEVKGFGKKLIYKIKKLFRL